MSLDEFIDSTKSETSLPSGLSLPLQALWWDARGEWGRAHELCQEAGSKDGDWVHAYLHRKEGDEGNASYWYSRAGRPKPSVSLEHEWEAIVRALFGEADNPG